MLNILVLCGPCPGHPLAGYLPSIALNLTACRIAGHYSLKLEAVELHAQLKKKPDSSGKQALAPKETARTDFWHGKCNSG
jgi:hypothetical protein